MRDSGLKRKKIYWSTMIWTHAPPPPQKKKKNQLLTLLYIERVERAAP